MAVASRCKSGVLSLITPFQVSDFGKVAMPIQNLADPGHRGSMIVDDSL
jgi:hypothetical protein